MLLEELKKPHTCFWVAHRNGAALQTRRMVWKYAATIAGQYHSVTVNYNIVLLSRHRSENLTPPLDMNPRKENLRLIHHGWARPGGQPVTLIFCCFTGRDAGYDAQLRWYYSWYPLNGRLEAQALLLSGSTEVVLSAEHLFHTISVTAGVKSNCLPRENMRGSVRRQCWCRTSITNWLQLTKSDLSQDLAKYLYN